jgi:hypothetical protein
MAAADRVVLDGEQSAHGNASADEGYGMRAMSACTPFPSMMPTKLAQQDDDDDDDDNDLMMMMMMMMMIASIASVLG